MILNELQKIDFYKGLKEMSYLITVFDAEHLDIKGLENRIQQAIGILNLLESLNFQEEDFRQIVIKALKTLYAKKKELQFGYDESRFLKKEWSHCY